MGFKKTSEGRVFFTGNKNTANDQHESYASEPKRGLPSQTEILVLLKTLNERLKITQAERNKMRDTLETYGSLIGSLDQRTQDAEHAMSVLKNMQQEQSQNISRYADGYAKITKRLRLTEDKVDKAIEDRARFMRKIERIEETVLQTRDAIQGQSNRLFSDDVDVSSYDEKTPENMLDDMLLQHGVLNANERFVAMQDTDKSSGILKGLAIATLVALAIAGGWLFNDMQRSQIGSMSDSVLSNQSDASSVALNTPDAVPQNWSIEENTQAFDSIVDASVAANEETASVASNSEFVSSSVERAIDVNDIEQISNMFESDSDALAAALNNLEPGAGAAKPAASAVEIKSEPANTSVQKISVPKKDPVSVKSAPVKPAASIPVVNNGKMQPDAGLPDVIKTVESKAFEGVAEAQHDLAAIYIAGHAGVKQDYKRAAHWFRQAADNGISNAAYNLGVLHHQGLGVPANLDQALDWYKKAAALGHAEAQYNLGIAYIEGLGVQYSPQNASEFFESAANGGVMEAAYNLGLIYENGLLGKPRPEDALRWYKKASDQGSPEAKSALAQLAKTLGVRVEDVNKMVDDMDGKQSSVVPQKSKSVKTAAKLSQKKRVVKRSNIAKNTSPKIQDNGLVEVPVFSTSSPSSQAVGGSNQMIVSQTQSYLMKAGLYPGPVDGRIGPLTSDAIRTYQSLNNLSVDGQASSSLLSFMLSNAQQDEFFDIGTGTSQIY